LLIGIAAVVVCSQFALVQNAAPQQAKRTFENKIPEHVPLKVKIKKDKEKKRSIRITRTGFAISRSK